MAYNADQGSAHKGRALAADIHNAKVFAGLLRGDDACKIRAGQGLNATLKHPNKDSKHPELQLAFEEDRKNRNAEVGDDTKRDKTRSGDTLRQSAK